MLPKWAMRLPMQLISQVAERHGLNPRLVAAVVQVESSGNPQATRHEPAWRYFKDVGLHAARLGIPVDQEEAYQAHSWGLMQVMGSVARELGFRYHLPQLLDPPTGLEYGCRKLAACLKRWPLWEEGLAAYNGGSPRRERDGDLVPELRDYVRKVYDRLDTLKVPRDERGQGHL
jgi:soluble lytic murein transglycosylase-like protein